MKTLKQPRTLYLIQLGCSLAGVGLSLYLLAQHTRLKSGIQVGASFCSLGRLADCDVVNSSPYSDIFGIPIAALGALYFFLVGLLLMIAPPRCSSFRDSQRWVTWLALIGIAVDSCLFFIQLALVHSVCVLCMLTYAANIGLLIAAIAAVNKPNADLRTRLKLCLFPTLGKKDRMASQQLAIPAVALICFMGILFLMPSAIRLTSRTYALVDDAIGKFYQDWKERKAKEITATSSNGQLGDPNSKIRIVEFSDFQCPFCRKAAFTLHTALTPIKDKVHFVFKNFPLDSNCNPNMKYQLHAHACDLARLGYCANQKGEFWRFHDRLFLKITEGDLDGGLPQIRKLLGDMFTDAQFDACLSSTGSLKAVQDDIKQGNALGVTGTPAIYINGKHVTIPLTVETIRQLIQIEAALN